MTAKNESSLTDKSDRAKNLAHGIMCGALALAWLGQLVQGQSGSNLEACVLILAVGACITALTRQIPLQNVLLGVTITGVIGGLAHALTAQQGLGIPFGPVFFQENSGEKIFKILPWPVPLIWIVALFSSRGTARVMLRPWRKLKSYGYWLIGLTAVLAMGFDLALEPFAAEVQRFWSWQPTKIPFTWYGASPLNYMGWALVSLLILAFATPALIKKKPGSRSPLDLSPLGIWLAAVILFGVACARATLWPAVVLDGSMVILVLGFAIPGARW